MSRGKGRVGPAVEGIEKRLLGVAGECQRHAVRCEAILRLDAGTKGVKLFIPSHRGHDHRHHRHGIDRLRVIPCGLDEFPDSFVAIALPLDQSNSTLPIFTVKPTKRSGAVGAVRPECLLIRLLIIDR